VLPISASSPLRSPGLRCTISAPVKPTESCAWCLMPIGDFERVLRFMGQLYHPGCLIQRRLTSPTLATVAAAPPAPESLRSAQVT
jgi:hypothetical protein